MKYACFPLLLHANPCSAHTSSDTHTRLFFFFSVLLFFIALCPFLFSGHYLLPPLFVPPPAPFSCSPLPSLLFLPFSVLIIAHLLWFRLHCRTTAKFMCCLRKGENGKRDRQGGGVCCKGSCMLNGGGGGEDVGGKGVCGTRVHAFYSHVRPPPHGSSAVRAIDFPPWGSSLLSVASKPSKKIRIVCKRMKTKKKAKKKYYTTATTKGQQGQQGQKATKVAATGQHKTTKHNDFKKCHGKPVSGGGPPERTNE